MPSLSAFVLFALSVFLRLFRRLIVFRCANNWRFLYKCSPESQDATGGPWPHYYFARGDRAEYGSVCVCHPLYQRVQCHRFHYHHLTRQGGSDPFSSHCLTKTLLIGCDIRRGRSLNVPAEFSTSCYTTFPRFVSWFFMLPPPNLFLAACAAPTFDTADLVSCRCAPTFVKQYLFTDSATLPFHCHFTWEVSVTENQCQSV